MTRQDRIILRYLKAKYQNIGRLPTLKEACFDLDMRHGQLQRHLKRLAVNGYLVRSPSIAYRLPHAA